ncbi:MAG: Cyclin D1-binding domain-containing protein [Candidatus Methylacidiphilales bacterium]|nr:Cyclin D1-binding domain-containing protein [Candidatus Methylacidiphilales bacterium]
MSKRHDPELKPKPNLTGEWIGHYKGHFDEVIRIQQTGDEVVAIKITGDDYVPAEEITWKASLATGEGMGQIAEEEFRNPRFVPGKLRVVNPERIIFTWSEYGAVEYRKDD